MFDRLGMINFLDAIKASRVSGITEYAYQHYGINYPKEQFPANGVVGSDGIYGTIMHDMVDIAGRTYSAIRSPLIPAKLINMRINSQTDLITVAASITEQDLTAPFYNTDLYRAIANTVVAVLKENNVGYEIKFPVVGTRIVVPDFEISDVISFSITNLQDQLYKDLERDFLALRRWYANPNKTTKSKTIGCLSIDVTGSKNYCWKMKKNCVLGRAASADTMNQLFIY